MSNPSEILQQKLNNFKDFVKQNATKTEVIEHYINMSYIQIVIFGKFYLASANIEEVVKLIVEKTGISDTEKLTNYLICFKELSQLV